MNMDIEVGLITNALTAEHSLTCTLQRSVHTVRYTELPTTQFTSIKPSALVMCFVLKDAQFSERHNLESKLCLCHFNIFITVSLLDFVDSFLESSLLGVNVVSTEVPHPGIVAHEPFLCSLAPRIVERFELL